MRRLSRLLCLCLGLTLLSPAGAAITREQLLSCAAARAGTDLRPAAFAACAAVEASYADDADNSEWVAETGAEGLRDLAATLPQSRERIEVPDPALVPELLAAIKTEAAEAPAGLWQRFRDWFEGLLNPQAGDAEPPEWLLKFGEWLQAVPGWIWKALFWATVALIVLSVLAVVIIELRASGVGAHRRARSRAPTGADEKTPEPPELDIADLDRLSPRLRCAALLQWLIRRLRGAGHLPADEARTNRELRRGLAGTPGATFETLLDGLEPAIYGSACPDDAEFARLRGLAVNLAKAP